MWQVSNAAVTASLSKPMRKPGQYYAVGVERAVGLGIEAGESELLLPRGLTLGAVAYADETTVLEAVEQAQAALLIPFRTEIPHG
jgi:hypothetical protein